MYNSKYFHFFLLTSQIIQLANNFTICNSVQLQLYVCTLIYAFNIIIYTFEYIYF